jgi:hypothetical protein
VTVAALDPETGIVELSVDLWRALSQSEPDESHRESLTAAGLSTDDRLLDPLAAAVRAVAESQVDLRLLSGGEEINGWIDSASLALTVPGTGATVRVLVMPRMFVAAAVARLVGLCPRPLTATPLMRVKPTALAAALAAPGSATLVPTALRHAIQRVERHWRLEVDATGTLQILEVLDSAEGLWRIREDDPDLTLEPVAAAQVWRALARLPLS